MLSIKSISKVQCVLYYTDIINYGILAIFLPCLPQLCIEKSHQMIKREMCY
jgi:hypothetical protein